MCTYQTMRNVESFTRVDTGIMLKYPIYSLVQPPPQLNCVCILQLYGISLQSHEFTRKYRMHAQIRYRGYYTMGCLKMLHRQVGVALKEVHCI